MHVRTGLGITKNRIEETVEMLKGKKVGSSLKSNRIASNFSIQVALLSDHYWIKPRFRNAKPHLRLGE